jgi:hypothetical protein
MKASPSEGSKVHMASKVKRVETISDLESLQMSAVVTSEMGVQTIARTGLQTRFDL